MHILQHIRWLFNHNNKYISSNKTGIITLEAVKEMDAETTKERRGTTTTAGIEAMAAKIGIQAT